MLQEFYTALFALSIVLINPFGGEGGSVWTYPKVVAVLALTLLNGWVIFQNRRQLKKALRGTKPAFLLWTLFLACGALSTLLSPQPDHSIWGHQEMWDGLVYWSGLSLFVLSSFLVARLRPELVRSQAIGLFAGGIILALSMIPQLFDWSLDYTTTSGKIPDPYADALESKVWRIHMPIGLYSHRGHAGFVLAACAALTFWLRKKNWISKPLAFIAASLTTTMLLFSQTRGPQLALLAAAAYLIFLSWKKKEERKLFARLGLTSFAVAGLLYALSNLFPIFETRELTYVPPAKTLKTEKTREESDELVRFTTGRTTLWKLAFKGIRMRPLLGWGHNGFAIAYPYVSGCIDDARKRGGFVMCNIMTTKAHCFLFDLLLSVGVVGLLVYLAMFLYFFQLARNGALNGLEAVAVAYLVFALTWFEAAQYSHIAWWALAAGAGSKRS